MKNFKLINSCFSILIFFFIKLLFSFLFFKNEMKSFNNETKVDKKYNY
jgi:hypothetical protein